MANVLSFPLTPIPLCFGQIDGTMNKTNKATLMNSLEKRVVSNPPRNIDIYVVDGFFFLHLMTNLPQMWGRVAREILIRLCRFPAQQIDLVFDRVISPSIKDSERDRRSDDDRSSACKISGPNQHRPEDFVKMLRNDNFKREIVRFLKESWSENSMAPILGSKVVHITYEECCYKIEVINEEVKITEIEDLRSSHEEADSRMIAHLTSIPAPSTVVVRTCDTDVLVIAVGNVSKLSKNIHVYLEMGIQSKNNLKFVDINALAKKIGPALASALPALHAFTGCDFTPCFSRKGKINPMTILANNTSICEAFARLGKSSTIDNETQESLEEFVCKMYGFKNITSVNEVRFLMFSKFYKPTSKNPMSSLKGLDGSALPPCLSVLYQQILRANVICSTWNNATVLNPKVVDSLY